MVDAYLFLDEEPKKLEEHLHNTKTVHLRRMQFLRDMSRLCENINDNYQKATVKEIKDKAKEEAEKEN